MKREKKKTRRDEAEGGGKEAVSKKKQTNKTKLSGYRKKYKLQKNME